jgi:hypothetical protein
MDGIIEAIVMEISKPEGDWTTLLWFGVVGLLHVPSIFLGVITIHILDDQITLVERFNKSEKATGVLKEIIEDYSLSRAEITASPSVK